VDEENEKQRAFQAEIEEHGWKMPNSRRLVQCSAAPDLDWTQSP
jgi:hypothetical protein